MEEQLILEREAVLEKFPGKGGWTFVRLPEISPDKKSPFGWRKVKGFIDDYPIKQFLLMPMGNGQLFLPVKAAIRKSIRKEEGCTVRILLYADHSELEVPKEFLMCLEDEPHALENFRSFPEREQKKYINWISSVKTQEAKVEKIAKAIDLLEKGLFLK